MKKLIMTIIMVIMGTITISIIIQGNSCIIFFSLIKRNLNLLNYILL